ncbi:MAG: type IV pilin N-terminal domain-containing protein [Bacilli bacterium]|jgi:FlaG/FlaF family flagellin (archaellin)|nr:type IV pilin N-terminal domain-containing protein [Bacilli bacterium]
MNNHKKTTYPRKNDGVSPVIGVMLMLVVTIIIAAFVSMFAGDIFADTEASPSAVLNVKIVSGAGSADDQYVMLLENMGGDSIPSSDIKIMTYYTSTGTERKVIKGEATAQTMTKLRVTTDSGDVNIVVPILANIAAGSIGETMINFGKYEFASGTVMTTYNSAGTTKVLGFNVTDTDNYGFKKGSKVTITVIHTPSQSVLYNKEVIVE